MTYQPVNFEMLTSEQTINVIESGIDYLSDLEFFKIVTNWLKNDPSMAGELEVFLQNEPGFEKDVETHKNFETPEVTNVSNTEA